MSGLSNVAAVAGGGFHGLALLADGTVRAWGKNDVGQLGTGTTTDSLVPVTVSGLTSVLVTAIAAGDNHTLALLSNGTVRAWGNNDVGQLGNNSTTNSSAPVAVSGLTDVAKIAAGAAFSLALKGDGTLWAWGYNGEYQLGDGTTTNRLTPVQVFAPAGFTFDQLAAAGNSGLVTLQPAVPEPAAALSLAAAGLGGCGWARRRRVAAV